MSNAAHDEDPLSAREGWSVNLDAVYEGIPSWLKSSLRQFVLVMLKGSDYGARLARVEATTRVLKPLSRLGPHRGVSDAEHRNRRIDLLARVETDERLGLSVIDALLGDTAYHSQEENRAIGELQNQLTLGGSAYEVADRSGNRKMLRRRIDPAYSRVVDDAVSGGGTASKHLRNGIEAAYGLDPEPAHACMEAVKAIEAAMRPIIIPNDGTGTLGRIIGVLGDSPGSFKMRVDPRTPDDRPPVDAIATLRDILKMVWQSSPRHGGNEAEAHQEVTPDAARDIVIWAATIVQLATSEVIGLAQPG